MREDIDQLEIASMPLQPAVTLLPGVSLQQAARLMRDNRVGCAFAVDDIGRPIGRFTNDQLLALISQGTDPVASDVFDYLAPVGRCVGYREPIARLLSAIEPSDIALDPSNPADQSPTQCFVCIVDERGRPAALAGVNDVNQFIASYLASHQAPRPKRALTLTSTNAHQDSAAQQEEV